MVEIERLQEASERAVSDISALLKQLRENPEEHSATLDELQLIVGDTNIILMVAKDGDRIVGMATLYILNKLGKRTATIEDVVVDGAYRGQGVGERLTRALIDASRREHVKTIHLTSRPERTAGNKLYQKLGFELKKTNPYSLKV